MRAARKYKFVCITSSCRKKGRALLQICLQQVCICVKHLQFIRNVAQCAQRKKKKRRKLSIVAVVFACVWGDNVGLSFLA